MQLISEAPVSSQQLVTSEWHVPGSLSQGGAPLATQAGAAAHQSWNPPVRLCSPVTHTGTVSSHTNSLCQEALDYNYVKYSTKVTHHLASWPSGFEVSGTAICPAVWLAQKPTWEYLGSSPAAWCRCRCTGHLNAVVKGLRQVKQVFLTCCCLQHASQVLCPHGSSCTVRHIGHRQS